MSTNYAFRVNAWGAGVKTSFTTSTAAIVLGSPNPVRVVMIATVACHVIFGTASVIAATTSHMLVPANTFITVDIPPGVTHFRVVQDSTGGDIYHAPVA